MRITVCDLCEKPIIGDDREISSIEISGIISIVFEDVHEECGKIFKSELSFIKAEVRKQVEIREGVFPVPPPVPHLKNLKEAVQ